jgi:MFS family permease
MKKSRPLFPVLTVNFIGTLGYSIVIPFLVFLVERYGGNAIVFGIVGATYSTFQLVGAPLLGKWSDLYGRKRILLLSQLGTLFSWAIFGVALFLPQISLFRVDSSLFGSFTLTLPLIVVFVARAFDGITGGNVSVANAYLADITDEEDRSRNFGKMSVSSNLGFILGPILAGALGTTMLGERVPVFGAFTISAVAVFIIIRYMPETKLCVLTKSPEEINVRKVFGQEHRECYEIAGKVSMRVRDVLKLTGIFYIIVLYFFIFLGFNIFYTAFPIHAVKGLRWTVPQLSLFFTLLGGLMILVQGPVLNVLSRKCSDTFLIIVGCMVLSGNFILMSSKHLILIYTAAALFAIGNGLMWPSFLSFLSTVAGKRYQGTVQGVANSAGSLASIIGLIVGGILYENYGSYTFLFSSVFIFMVFLLSFRLKKFTKVERA